ncbi:antibiotic biosynthesis monooxygenase [Jatrophihabitans sp.]|uniref:putative quinol monooxygenase n=1 Tax=Jatrophihabitans sp. TaxID=1932789 RepID=UPI0030C73BA2|nr:antibiotic biosynthesis monooxygenase [Jatrophihabitans sp.]
MADSPQFGALLQLTAREGLRDELVRVLGNYLNTLEGEPGTLLVAFAADPNDENLVWAWEEFADANAVQAHFEHDFFRALQMELADLLAETPLVRPLAPIAHRVQPGVVAE